MQRFVAMMVLGLAVWAVDSRSAQAQIQSVPIDTNALIVKPADTATNIFSGTMKYLNRAVADAVDGNGFVKTINNLLGRKTDSPSLTQPNGLPNPNRYPSYPTVIRPVMPTQQVYGQSPVLPTTQR